MAETLTLQPSSEEQKSGGFFGKLKDALTTPIGGAKKEEGRAATPEEMTEVPAAVESEGVVASEGTAETPVVVEPERMVAESEEVTVGPEMITPQAVTPKEGMVSAEVTPAPTGEGLPPVTPPVIETTVPVPTPTTTVEAGVPLAVEATTIPKAEATLPKVETTGGIEGQLPPLSKGDGQQVEGLGGLKTEGTVQKDTSPKIGAVVDGAVEAAKIEKMEPTAEDQEKSAKNPEDVAQVREIQMNWLVPKMQAATGQEKAALTALNGFLEAYSNGSYDDLEDIKAQLAENGYKWIEEPVLDDEQQRVADLTAAEEAFDMKKFDQENPPELGVEVVDGRRVESINDLGEAEIAVGQASLNEEAKFREMFDRLFKPGMEMGTLTDAEKQELVDEMTENTRRMKEQQFLDEADQILVEAAKKEVATRKIIREVAAFLAELQEREKQNKVA